MRLLCIARWIAITVGVWAGVPLRTSAAPGDVDLSFNPGLRVNDYVYAIATQPDGKVVIGGIFNSPSPLLARLNLDGSVDRTFNFGTGANGIIFSIAVQSDGKIVIGGAFTLIQGVSRNRIARLNPDGQLDLTFDPGTGADGRVRAVVASGNGKVLIAGDFHEVNQVTRVRVARLNANGSVDATFNPGVGADQEVLAMAVQSDGRVILGGYFLTVNDVPRNYLCRLNANGSVDENFDPGEGPNLDVDSIALQSDGRIVVGGGFDSVNGHLRGRVARLHGDGSVDESFDPGSGADFHVSAIVVQTDGSIVVGGNFGSFNGVPSGNLVRLKSDGGVDQSFHSGDGVDGGIYALAKSGGPIFIGGAFRIVNGITRNYVARLASDGAVDTSFEPNTGPDYPVLSVAPDKEGRVLIGGYFTVVGGVNRHYVARLHSDGRLDTSFNPGLGANGRVQCVLPLPGSQTLIGGLFTAFDGTNRAHLARLNPDGTLDPTFDPGTGANGDVLGLAFQADGRTIVVGDFTSFDGQPCGRIIRLLTDGRVDPTFSLIGANLTIKCVLAQPDGKILIGGDFTSVDGTNQGRIARLRSDGRIDPGFGLGLGANATVECLALQSDGRIVLGGQFSNVSGTNRGRLARLTSSGQFDPSFTPSVDGVVLAMVVSQLGEIVIAGDFFNVGGVSRAHVARLWSDGRVDLRFDPGIGADDTVSALALQADGRILVGGFFDTINGIGRSSLARLEADAPRPTLRLTRAGGGIIATWPAAFSNFTLQTTTDLSPTVDWVDTPQVPGLSGGEWSLSTSIVGPAGYFRLKSF